MMAYGGRLSQHDLLWNASLKRHGVIVSPQVTCSSRLTISASPSPSYPPSISNSNCYNEDDRPMNRVQQLRPALPRNRRLRSSSNSLRLLTDEDGQEEIGPANSISHIFRSCPLIHSFSSAWSIVDCYKWPFRSFYVRVASWTEVSDGFRRILICQCCDSANDLAGNGFNQHLQIECWHLEMDSSDWMMKCRGQQPRNEFDLIFHFQIPGAGFVFLIVFCLPPAVFARSASFHIHKHLSVNGWTCPKECENLKRRPKRATSEQCHKNPIGIPRAHSADAK